MTNSEAKPKSVFLDWLLNRSLSAPLAIGMLLLIMLVSPDGNFPLNDDWVYGKSVLQSLQQNRLVVHPYAAALSITHVMWGWGFAYAIGFSYTVLRVSTLALGFVGAWAAAASMRTMGQHRSLCLLCGALVMLNPIYLSLSYTFMTDVPFVAFTAMAGLSYLRALRHGQANDVLLGTFFCIFASFNRQFGMLVWAAYVLTLLMLWWRRGLRPELRTMISLVAPWIASAPIIWYWIATRDTDNPLIIEVPPSEVYREFVSWLDVIMTVFYIGLFLLPLLFAYGYARLTRHDNNGRWLRYVLIVVFVIGYAAACWIAIDPWNIFVALWDRFALFFGKIWGIIGFASMAIAYLGLFLLPVGLSRAYVVARNVERWTFTQKLFFAGFVLVFVASNYSDLPLPSIPNMLTDLAVGPRTLVDTYKINYGWSTISLGSFAWWIITVLAAISGGVLINDLVFNGLVHLFDPRYLRLRPRADWIPHQEVFLLFWATLMLASLYNPFIQSIYDRYLLQGLVPCCILCCSHLNITRSADLPRKLIVWVFTAAVGLFAIAALQDYMTWNRARWDAAESLIQEPRITPNQVDGGFEFNGLYTSDMALAKAGTEGLVTRARNWWVVDDKYAISFLPRDGYRTLYERYYFTWLGMRNEKLLVLERIQPSPPKPTTVVPPGPPGPPVPQ